MSHDAALGPVPITDFAMCNALGETRAHTLAALRSGLSGLGSSPIALPFPATVGAIRAPLPELPSALAAWSTRTNRIASMLITSMEAGLQRLRARWRPERIAVLLGSSTAGADVTEHAYRDYMRDGVLPEGYDLFKQHTYGSVLHVLRSLSGARGPGWVASTACTSSAKPLASARRLLAADLIDAAIVGGIDTLCGMTLRGFHSLEALSPTACRPFAQDRDGLNIGEGGALMLVERRGDAMACLKGVGESSDAYHISAPHPEGAGAVLAMERALCASGCQAKDIDHINAHGTGTRLNDIAEANAITAVFSATHPEVPVVSTKGYTGHTLGAAGATEACMAVLSILHGFVPASLRADPVDARISLRIAGETLEGPCRHVLSNCFAFGGNNVSVVLSAP